MSAIKEEISKNLLNYRKSSGLTQKEFASMLGVNNTAVSNWESGNNSIDIETLFSACEIFGVTLDDMCRKHPSNSDICEPEIYDYSLILERLKSAKKDSGLTNEELSVKSCVPIGTLSKIMSGETQEPGLHSIFSISNALGVSLSFIVYGRAPAPVNLPSDSSDLVEKYSCLNITGRAKVHSYIDDLLLTNAYSIKKSRRD